MSQSLVHSSGGGLAPRRDERLASRGLASLDLRREVAIARIESQAQVEAARVHAVGYVGQQALQAVAMVSQLEGQLGAICPLAVSRLQAVADMTALAVVQTITDAHRRLS